MLIFFIAVMLLILTAQMASFDNWINYFVLICSDLVLALALCLLTLLTLQLSWFVVCWLVTEFAGFEVIRQSNQWNSWAWQVPICRELLLLCLPIFQCHGYLRIWVCNQFRLFLSVLCSICAGIFLSLIDWHFLVKFLQLRDWCPVLQHKFDYFFQPYLSFVLILY